MKRVRRFPRLGSGLVRWTSLCVCFALVVSVLIIVPIQREAISLAQGVVAPPPPMVGPPAASLPNLEQVRRQPQRRPVAPPHVPSNIRSRRRPLQPRNGRRVGDPGTLIADVDRSGSGSDRVSSRTVREGSATVNDRKRNHPGAKAASAPIGDDQYVQTFFTWALARDPNGTEKTYWYDILRKGYANSQTSMVMATRELGKTLFESSAYAARNRNNHWFVYDLYKTYLMRDPDSGGWAYWEGQVPNIGREATRRAFDECGEFIYWVSTVTPNGSASSAASSLISARIDPNNQPGGGLLTRDTTWGVSLLSLPGRAGLDLGLGLSYSSQVWTRSGPNGLYLYFDEDYGWPSPGFRLGFATVQEKYFDAQVGVNVYLLISSSGRRTELRQVGTSNIYEAADSSYLQLADNGSSLLVRTTDGTQLSYSKFENEWRATQIKDRNGNYLTVNYDWSGQITEVIDTLGRLVNFNYDEKGNLVSISQNWNGQPHEWVTFGWSEVNIQTSFPVDSVVGAPNGTGIPVLGMVGFDDGTYTKFLYNAYGQVTRITNYASDSNPNFDDHARNYVAYDYDSSSSDCRRLIATRLWAENWNELNGVPPEVQTNFNVTGDGSHQMTLPDETVVKEVYGTGWQKGLLTSSEVRSGGVPQKWTTVSYTQDNPSVSYQTNPRMTDRYVYDAAGNQRRTKMEYTQFTLPSGVFCNLPSDSKEYAADTVTVLRRSHTDYNLSSTYLDRRIIGLSSTQSVYDAANNLVAKTDLLYDETALTNPGTIVRHDNTNYGQSFVSGRANLTSTRRYDVINTANSTVTNIAYNKAGAPVSITDPLSHQFTITYASASSTFAYPTLVTDAGGFSSEIQYNYDTGATIQAKGKPAGQGAIQTFTYDDAGRLERVTTTNNGAYTRNVYGPTYVQSFSSVNTVADEAYTIQIFDGAGRVIAAGGNHPGSTGGYRGQVTYYDSMGRPVKTTNPTEVTAGWVPFGDDGTGLNVASAANGGTATASSNTPDSAFPPMTFTPFGAIDGDRVGFGNHNAWRDYTDNTWPDWLQVDFNGSKTINEIDVFTLKDDFETNSLPPTENTTFTLYGITAFDVQYWNGNSWVTISGGSVTGNNKVWRKFSFSPITTTKIRVVVNNGQYGNSRIVELEAWSATGGGTPTWAYTQQTYDWQGRPLLTTNTDGTTKEATYGGCGCAGGAVVTLTDEGTIDGGVAKRRQQKIYSDVLGRTVKTEVLNWQGGSVYSATVNTYNALDQVTQVRQYQGLDTSSTYQDTTMTFDGYGRLKTKHLPEQQVDANNSASTNHTKWDYNADDTIQKVTDARGAASTFTYNSRHLVTGISYTAPTVTAPGSPIPVPSPVSFSYDAAGNRTSMTDGTGSMTYAYNNLSRLTSETREFAGLSGGVALTYQYNLAGQLKRITDPTNMTINYNYDAVGRIVSVTGEGTLVENVSTYASNLAYRAWGGLRDLNYGNGAHTHLNYNQRLQPTSLALSNVLLPPYNNPSTMTWNSDYYADGRVNHTYDVADDHFDRKQDYDHVGQLKEAYIGREARGLPPTTPFADSSYRQTMQHDVWGNMTSKSGRFWRTPISDSAVYTNNRRQYWQYDAEGNMVNGDGKLHTFDARGSQTQFISWANSVGGFQTGHEDAPGIEIAQTYNADGQSARRIETRRTEELVNGGPQTNITEEVTTTYNLYSSVLGGAKVVEFAGGQKSKGYVYVNGQRLAKQEVNQWYDVVTWHHPNNGSNSWMETSSQRYVTRQEMDPMGAEVGVSDPWLYWIDPSYLDLRVNEPLYIEGGDPFDYSGGHTIDGLPVSNSEFARRTGDGTGSVTVSWQGHDGQWHTGGPGTRFFPGANGISIWVDDSEYIHPHHDEPDDGVVRTWTDLLQKGHWESSHGQAQGWRGGPPIRGPYWRRKSMDHNEWRNFKKAYDLALSKLDDFDCRRALGQLSGVLDWDGKFGPKAVLEAIYNRSGFVRGGPNRYIADTFQLGRFSTIRLHDKFFEGQTGASNYDLENLLDYRETLAHTIMHELVHALSADHGSWDTEEGRKEGERWNDKIYEACFAKRR